MSIKYLKVLISRGPLDCVKLYDGTVSATNMGKRREIKQMNTETDNIYLLVVIPK